MGSSAAYIEANRETINQKRRNMYDSESRKADYKLKREEISKKGKEDRINCPLCGLSFRRLYVKRHIENRHEKKLGAICPPINHGNSN
jgi:uncharacterized C2H2 Zn-finger protein